VGFIKEYLALGTNAACGTGKGKNLFSSFYGTYFYFISLSFKLTYYEPEDCKHGEKMDLSRVKCPVSLIYGDLDLIIDAEALRKQLDPSVLRHVQKVEGYEHMDALWAVDAPTTVFPLISRLLQ